MLPKAQRVTKTLFPELLGKGVFCSSTSFSARIIPSPKTKCSVVVSKKVAGTAVLRNRIKRRFSAALEHVLADLKKKNLLRQPFAAAFFVRIGGKDAKEIPISDLEAEILWLLKKVKLV